MAIKIPAIPEIEDASEMINLVASSAKFKDRMTALVDIYDKIKTGLETYKQYQDIDAKFGEAQNLVVEAKLINTDAHEKVRQVKEQEQASLAEITKRHDALEQWYLGARDGAEARDRALDEREALLAKREAQAVALALESQHALDTSAALIKENDTLRLELESKLAQLRKIAV